MEERFLSKVKKTKGCWLWQGAISKNGYGVYAVKRQPTYAHRVSHELFKGKIPHGKWVLHSCDNRCCVNPAHLRVGDRSDNMIDCVQRVRHNNQKLILSDIHTIRELRASGKTYKSIADIYGVAFTTIHKIIMRETWKHV